MRQGLAREIGIDERDGESDSRQPQPHRQIFRAIRHEQGHGIARLPASRQSPACILVAADGEAAIRQAGFGRYQCRCCPELGRKAFDQHRQCHPDMLGGPGPGQGPDPRIAGKFRIGINGLCHGNHRSSIVFGIANRTTTARNVRDTLRTPLSGKSISYEARNNRNPRRFRLGSDHQGGGRTDLPDGRLFLRQCRARRRIVQPGSAGLPLLAYQQPDDGRSRATRDRARRRGRLTERGLGTDGSVLRGAERHGNGP